MWKFRCVARDSRIDLKIQRDSKNAQIRHLGDTRYENTRRRVDKTELDAEKEARRPTVCFTVSPVSTTSSTIFLAASSSSSLSSPLSSASPELFYSGEGSRPADPALARD